MMGDYMTNHLNTKRKHSFYVSVFLSMFLSVSGGVYAQDTAGTLGKALVSKAQEKTEDTLETPAAPSAPLSPSLDGEPEKPLLNIGILDGIKLPSVPSQDEVLNKVESDVELELKRLEEAQGKLPSILFSEREAERLDQAIAMYESGNFVKKPEGLPEGGETPSQDPLLNVEIVDRNLVLGGISYGDGENWVIWLNKQRLTPARLPVEVKYVKVYKSHVDIKWLDKLTGQLIPVRLRPNQRFNLDARSFLPG
jgi:hypothetical protein